MKKSIVFQTEACFRLAFLRNEEMKMLDEMLGMTSFELERIKQVVDKVIVHAPDELEIVYKANNFIREMVEVG